MKELEELKKATEDAKNHKAAALETLAKLIEAANQEKKDAQAAADAADVVTYPDSFCNAINAVSNASIKIEGLEKKRQEVEAAPALNAEDLNRYRSAVMSVLNARGAAAQEKVLQLIGDALTIVNAEATAFQQAQTVINAAERAAGQQAKQITAPARAAYYGLTMARKSLGYDE